MSEYVLSIAVLSTVRYCTALDHISFIFSFFFFLFFLFLYCSLSQLGVSTGRLRPPVYLDLFNSLGRSASHAAAPVTVNPSAQGVGSAIETPSKASSASQQTMQDQYSSIQGAAARSPAPTSVTRTAPHPFFAPASVPTPSTYAPSTYAPSTYARTTDTTVTTGASRSSYADEVRQVDAMNAFRRYFSWVTVPEVRIHDVLHRAALYEWYTYCTAPYTSSQANMMVCMISQIRRFYIMISQIRRFYIPMTLCMILGAYHGFFLFFFFLSLPSNCIVPRFCALHSIIMHM